jgi:hypothetical protein
LHELQRHDATGLARALHQRRLAKRALDVAAADLPADPAAWPADDPDLVERVEDRLAREVGLAPGQLFLDFPAKPGLLEPDLPLVRRDGTLTRLAGAEARALLGLARVAGELYRTARRLRVLVLAPARISAAQVALLVTQPRDEVAARLDADRPLL